MTEEKINLFGDAVEMVEIFRSLPDTEKAVAIAYIAGRVGLPLDTIIRLPKEVKQGPAA